MAAKALLDENPKPTEDEVKEWMSGNLCRCTGYYKILESVMAVVNNKISPDFQFRKREQQAKIQSLDVYKSVAKTDRRQVKMRQVDLILEKVGSIVSSLILLDAAEQ